MLENFKKNKLWLYSIFDDDCIVDNNWFKNVFNIINIFKADIVTGPQIYLNKDKKNFDIGNYSKRKIRKMLLK